VKPGWHGQAPRPQRAVSGMSHFDMRQDSAGGPSVVQASFGISIAMVDRVSSVNRRHGGALSDAECAANRPRWWSRVTRTFARVARVQEQRDLRFRQLAEESPPSEEAGADPSSLRGMIGEAVRAD
jgi:hypothetical protein